MVPVLRRHYELFIPVAPGEETPGTPSAYLLAAGYSHGEPFIVKVDPTGLVARYDEVRGHVARWEKADQETLDSLFVGDP